MAISPEQANGTSGDTTTSTTQQKEKVVLTKVSEFPLSTNGLEDLVTFIDTPAGLCLVSKVDLPAGSHFSYLTSHVPQASPTWRTIQTSAKTHTDPRSALLYMNHSCDPSLEVHVYSPDVQTGVYSSLPPDGQPLQGNVEHLITEAGLAGEGKVSRSRAVKVGEPLTFFYPSTEWSMDRAFDCLCGADKGVCLGKVQGAKFIPEKRIDDWFLNEHVLNLRKAEGGAA